MQSECKEEVLLLDTRPFDEGIASHNSEVQAAVLHTMPKILFS